MTTALRLLLLDDSEVDADRVQAALRDGGIEFTARRVGSVDGLEQALHEWRPAAVLAERRLPGFDGVAVLERVHTVGPRTPVIFVTTAPADAVAVELLRAGAVDYVAKDALRMLAPALQRAIDEADDTRARTLAHRRLQRSEMQFRHLFESSHEGIAVIDASTATYAEANRRFLELAGMRREEVLNHELSSLGATRMGAVLAVVFRQLRQTDNVHYEHLQLHVGDGETRDVEVLGSSYHVGGEFFVQCTLRDITARLQAEIETRRVRDELQAEVTRRQQAQEALELVVQKLTEDTMRDHLTGLYNRHFLDQTLPRAVAQAHRHRWLFSVLLIEIDHYRDTVDKHGLAAGDLLLRSVAALLRGTFRESDTVCRLGEDSFVVLLPGTGPVAARDTATRLQMGVHALELVLDGVALSRPVLSIGVSALSRAGQSGEALMLAADRALQRSRQAGQRRAQLSSDYVTLDAMPE